MSMSSYLIAAVMAYFLGSIPFGFLLVLLVRKEDIRATGSGNIGATNVVRSGAKGLGALTFLLDGGKGYVAVVVARWLARGESAENVLHMAILAGLCAVLGHIFPVWLRFKGGKGVATAFGVFLALSPLAALASFVLWLVTMLLTKYVSLASILGAAVLPFLTLWWSPIRYGWAWGALMFACAAIVIVKHHENIQRLLAGTEHGFGARKTGA
jgi:acyl phosphate:glycerol-3-phosphate acyltransferase